MKTLTKIIFLTVFPFCVNAQSSTFHSIFNKKHKTIIIDTIIDDLDSIKILNVSPRFFGLTSYSNYREIFNTYLIGLELDAKIGKQFSFVALYDYIDGNHNSDIVEYQDSLGVYYPNFGFNKSRFQFNIKYSANNFITFDFGHGRQFIGSGYQSLILSDVSSPYPYFKITTNFGPVKYYNLFSTFINPNMVDFGRKKHAAIHYLDFAISPGFNLGIFESILWQSKSLELNKGYELAYLNPIIFYRPVEFSKQSSKGNALIGINFNLKFKKILLYGQFMLDDLNISKQKELDENYEGGFFQNKYAFQLGLKGKINNFKYLLEYNQVQPYTYGHRTILQNYSHMNQALAHPLGANFREIINILELNKGKWTYKITSMLSYVGLDSLGSHYGQNIFESDLEASTGGQYSYGNFNGQGVKTSILSLRPEVSFKLKGFDIFSSIHFRIKDSSILEETSIFYSVGLRNFLFPSSKYY